MFDLEAHNAQVVANVLGQPVNRGELEAAFNRVANKENWKFPINAEIEIADQFDKELIADAIEFFAGCKAEFQFIAKANPPGKDWWAGKYVVKAAGYYAAVGA